MKTRLSPQPPSPLATAATGTTTCGQLGTAHALAPRSHRQDDHLAALPPSTGVAAGISTMQPGAPPTRTQAALAPPDVSFAAPQAAGRPGAAATTVDDGLHEHLLEDMLHEIFDGPSQQVVLLCQQIVAAAPLDPAFRGDAGHRADAAVTVWSLACGRLKEKAAAYAAYLDSPSLCRQDLNQHEETLMKLIIFVHKCQHKCPQHALAHAFDWNTLPRWLPLSLLEISSLILVLKEQKVPFPQGDALAAVIGGVIEPSCPRQPLRAQQRQFRQAQQDISQHPAYIAVQAHLGASRQHQRAADRQFWAQAIAQGNLLAIAERLGDLHKKVQRHLLHRQLLHLLSPQMRDPNDVIGQLIRKLHSAKQRLEEGSDFLAQRKKVHAARLKQFKIAKNLAASGHHEKDIMVEITTPKGEKITTSLDRYIAQEMVDTLTAVVDVGIFAEETIAFAQRLNRKTFLLFSNPQTTRQAIDEALATLDANDYTEATLAAQDLQVVYKQLHREYRKCLLVADKVQHFRDNAMLYSVLNNKVAAALEQLAQASAKAQTSRPEGPTTLSAPKEALSTMPSQAEQDAVGHRAEAQGFFQQVVSDARVQQQVDDALDDDGDLGSWQKVVPRWHRAYSQPFEAWIDKVFHPGTFGSPWRSCIRHFEKHALGQQPVGGAYDEQQVKAYVDDALAATGGWAAAQRDNYTYEEPSLDGTSARMRVINSPHCYLVMTMDTPPKIVSYRNRREHGF